jgi:regulator of protease activity HflC (stomatin/prohibitin superfamily)
LLFHARTQDCTDVTVQATVTYRFAEPDVVARRLDFSIDPHTGSPRGTPLDQVALLLTELAQQYALSLLASMPLATALVDGVAAVRSRVAEGLRADDRLTNIGIEIIAVRVVALRPPPDLERALQTPTREQVQQDADRATYERRALAVESERAISENELQSRIELAVRQERLVTQEGSNERRRAQEASAAERIVAEGRVERDRLQAAAAADVTRVVGAAEAETARARAVAYDGTDPRVLLLLGLRELAPHLPQIGSITLSPDMLTGALAAVTAASGAQPVRPRS